MEFYHHGIKGQKWGVRRYQNADGSLTPEGQKRYDRDVAENNMKKKENRAVLKEGGDPDRWVREDIERSKKVVDAHSDLVKEFKKLEQTTAPKPTTSTPKLDLSKMSDKELRDQINRKLLEQQYSKLFAETPPEQVSKGRTILKDTLEVAGSVLAIAGSSLSIALAIKEVKG